MNKSKLNRFIGLVEKSDMWAVDTHDNYISISAQGVDEDYTEEFRTDCTFAEFMGDVYRTYNNYDWEDHVEFWLCERQHNPNFGIPSAYYIIKDAKQIDKAWEALYDKAITAFYGDIPANVLYA